MFGSKKYLKTLFAFSAFNVILASGPSAGSDFKMIGTDQLHSITVDNAYRLEGGRGARFTIFDARTKEEYDRAHVFSAISIPEKDFDNSKFLLPEDKGALLIVYGDGTEADLCRKWAEKAEAAGYRNIEVYSEGFTAWKKEKMPVAPLEGSY